MRLAALYFFVCLWGIVGLASVCLGWKPSFISVLDLRSDVYLIGLFTVPVLVASAGLTWTVPKIVSLRRLASAPRYSAATVPILALIGAQRLHTEASAGEVAGIFFQATLFGLGLGTILALSEIFESKDEAVEELDDGRRHAIAIAVIVSLVVACMFLLVQRRPRDDGEFKAYAQLGDPSRQLVIGLKSVPVTGDRFGVLRITSGDETNALILEHSELDSVISLWASAEKSRGVGWRNIGEAGDTVLSDRGTLSITAGDGIRMNIGSPHSPNLSYQVRHAEIARVRGALLELKRDLDD